MLIATARTKMLDQQWRDAERDRRGEKNEGEFVALRQRKGKEQRGASIEAEEAGKNPEHDELDDDEPDDDAGDEDGLLR